MFRRILMVVVLALQFVTVANLSLAWDPDPGCLPCPDPGPQPELVAR